MSIFDSRDWKEEGRLVGEGAWWEREGSGMLQDTWA